MENFPKKFSPCKRRRELTLSDPVYSFFDFLLSTCPKKKWKLKNGQKLPTLPYRY